MCKLFRLFELHSWKCLLLLIVPINIANDIHRHREQHKETDTSHQERAILKPQQYIQEGIEKAEQRSHLKSKFARFEDAIAVQTDL